MSWELRHLRYFVAVAQELHFGRAAARLHIAQPALSRQIRRLEDLLGATLFHRTKRTVKLSRAGEAFLDRARVLLKHAEDATDLARGVHHGRRGRLTIGFIASASYTVLPAVLRRFRDQFPEVKIDLLQLRNRMQVEALQQDEIDIGILRPPVLHPSLETRLLMREPFVVALPGDHPLAQRTHLRIRHLRNEGFIMVPSAAAPFLEVIRSFCLKAGFEPRVVQEAIEIPTVIGLVSASMGVALVPFSSQRMHTANVVYRTVSGAPRTDTLLAYRHANPPALLLEFVRIARFAVREAAFVPGSAATTFSSMRDPS